jgi:CheY-like chemotaxis protein
MNKLNSGMPFVLMPTSVRQEMRVVTSIARPRQTTTLSRRILIVDDFADAADTLQALLVSQGHETCVTYNGRDALAAVRTQRFDVALIDLCMPDMSGYELVRNARAESIHLPKWVAVTGLIDLRSRQEAREAGFDHFVVKPYEIQALETLFESMAMALGD